MAPPDACPRTFLIILDRSILQRSVPRWPSWGLTGATPPCAAVFHATSRLENPHIVVSGVFAESVLVIQAHPDQTNTSGIGRCAFDDNPYTASVLYRGSFAVCGKTCAMLGASPRLTRSGLQVEMRHSMIQMIVLSIASEMANLMRESDVVMFSTVARDTSSVDITRNDMVSELGHGHVMRKRAGRNREESVVIVEDGRLAPSCSGISPAINAS